MANQYNNEIIYNGQTLINLKNDTATPEKVLSGETFHDRSGAPQTGTMIVHNVYDGLDSTSTNDALSANMGKVLNDKFQSKASTLSEFIAIFDETMKHRLIYTDYAATNALTGGRASVGAIVVGYKSYNNSVIVYYGQTSNPIFFSGYIDLSNNNITVNEMYAMRRVRCTFNGVTVAAGGYKKLCSYSAISNGIGVDNIVSVKVHSGTFSGAQTVEAYDDGLYLYSSSAYTNKYITLDIIYSPYATILYDTDKTITVT